MFSFFGYYGKEDKPVSQQVATLDVSGLINYIETKANFKTALELGKYKLALSLEGYLAQKIKEKEINYEEFKRDFYVAYKVNEFLESPDSYVDYEGDDSLKSPDDSFVFLLQPMKSIFNDRCGMGKLLVESKELGLALYAELEMKKIFRLFKKMLQKVNLPNELPDYLKTGTKIYGWTWEYSTSTLHPVIKGLYDQCQKKLAAAEKPAVSSPVVSAPS